MYWCLLNAYYMLIMSWLCLNLDCSQITTCFPVIRPTQICLYAQICTHFYANAMNKGHCMTFPDSGTSTIAQWLIKLPSSPSFMEVKHMNSALMMCISHIKLKICATKRYTY